MNKTKLRQAGFHLDLPQYRCFPAWHGYLMGAEALQLESEDGFSMSAATIAKQHLDQAMKEAELAGFDGDATARYMLGWVISKYLEYRTADDVRSELLFLADNFEPDTDFVFMRP